MTSHSLAGWRRVASAMWPAPRDPQIYGQLDLDAAASLRFIERARASGWHVTVTHLVARALTHALQEVPALNVRILGSRAVARPGIEIFFITALGDDLSGVKVDTTRRNVFALSEKLAAGTEKLRAGHDRAFARAKALMDRLPRPALRAALRGSALITERLGWSLPSMGLEASPFGSAIISSVGSLGLPSGFAPLSWMYDVPLLVLIGEVTDRACVVEGRVVVQPVLPLSFTIDHRYVDGAHLARALRALRDYLEAPEQFERAAQGVGRER